MSTMIDQKIQVYKQYLDLACPQHNPPATDSSSGIPESTAGNAGLKIEAADKLVAPNKAQLNLFAEQTQAIIKSRSGWQCKHCTCDSGRVGAGAGPHVARLDCAGCGSFVKWLSKRQMAAISGEAA